MSLLHVMVKNATITMLQPKSLPIVLTSEPLCRTSHIPKQVMDALLKWSVHLYVYKR